MTVTTTTIQDGIAEIRIDAPPVNALDLAGWRELVSELRAAGERDDVRVVLLTAAGKGFSAGVDIKELAADSALIVDVNRACYEAFRAVYELRVPVIAAVQGYCLGGGVGLAGSADLVVAATDASFGLPEIDRGAMGGATHAMRLFGMQRARRMLYTGEPVGAEEAFRLGGVDSVVERDLLAAEARALAAKIAAKSSTAVRIAKESLNGIEVIDVPSSYRHEQGFTLELYTSADSREARTAFTEKRDSSFEDRG